MPNEPRLDDDTVDGLIPIYRIVRDGIPRMDGTFKTVQVSSEMGSLELAEHQLEQNRRRGIRFGDNERIQRRWASPWEDVE